MLLRKVCGPQLALMKWLSPKKQAAGLIATSTVVARAGQLSSFLQSHEH